jgi:hypothetical protein
MNIKWCIDELTNELLKLGYEISRSGTYLRMLPKKSNITEGKGML